ncbi:hypothetical protein HMPREF1991_01234 [Hoylesella loescheii DSM 19665 = JCM 12249 = ATCC 15930]|uniref:Uncharacterized protein n=1 Tax=Hoylesella loescheii DSM 19665 = JCM 12249 = ATCC 15930 TaxID=1122985 RepID=A0A069QJ35_HOYLO|nr:hypothetical protein HMPREF6745_0886 [Prevotella sp. oral taxon 472 str. F0295]KDR52657.1 hypothetical protein HMPREF1991_01234 [Hoylesella loescheii DSM 19665 = JCM 12249 = ATCC 15930]
MGHFKLLKSTFRAINLAKRGKSSNFAPLFGVIAGRKKSYLAMLRWDDKQFKYQAKWI